MCVFKFPFLLGLESQLWRIENEGCLRNKAHMDKCLELEHLIDHPTRHPISDSSLFGGETTFLS